MKRKVIVFVALALLLLSAVGAFAYEQKSKTYSWMASFNKTGQLNLYLSAGFYAFNLGYDLSGGPEVILGNFDISGVPFQWGVMARGLLGFANSAGFANWIDWGVAPMVTLHWGTDFGKGLKFEWYGALGLGIYGTTGSFYSNLTGSGPFFGFAGAGGIGWHFADNFALILDYSYVGINSTYGIGIKFNL